MRKLTYKAGREASSVQSTVKVSTSVTCTSLGEVLWAAMAGTKAKATRVRATVERMLTFMFG